MITELVFAISVTFWTLEDHEHEEFNMMTKFVFVIIWTCQVFEYEKYVKFNLILLIVVLIARQFAARKKDSPRKESTASKGCPLLMNYRISIYFILREI